MALATQCPHCYTSFRVANDQLKLYAGLVRCGTCEQTFNGIDHLLSPGQEPRTRPESIESVAASTPTSADEQSTQSPPPFPPLNELPTESVVDAIANAVVDTVAEVEIMEDQLQDLVQEQPEPTSATAATSVTSAASSASMQSVPPLSVTSEDDAKIDPLYEKYFDTTSSNQADVITSAIDIIQLADQAEEIIAEEYVEIETETETETDIQITDEESVSESVEQITATSVVTIEDAVNMMTESAQLFDSINANDAVASVVDEVANEVADKAVDEVTEEFTDEVTDKAEQVDEAVITPSTSDIYQSSSLDFEEPSFYLEGEIEAVISSENHLATSNLDLPTQEVSEVEDNMTDSDATPEQQMPLESKAEEDVLEIAASEDTTEDVSQDAVNVAEEIDVTSEATLEDSHSVILETKTEAEKEAEAITENITEEVDNDVDNNGHEENNEDEQEEIKPQFVIQAEKKQRYGKWFTASYSLLILLLIITAFGQLSYHYRDQLYAHFPASRVPLFKACQLLKCQIRLLAEKGAVTKESQELVLLSSNPQILTLSVMLQNRSNTVQAWPMIELVLMDNRKKTLLQRVFTPQEYLINKKEVGLGIGASTEKNIDINFELGIPKAASYEVKLFYP